MLIPINEGRSNIIGNRVFFCHLSLDWRQMAIENTVSSDFYPRSAIFKSVFDCCLSGVIYAYGHYLTLDGLVSSDGWVSVRSFPCFVSVHMQ